jgi:hypothetical protein
VRVEPIVRVLALCCAWVITAPGIAAADWHFTPMAGMTFRANTNIVDLEDATSRVHSQFGGAVTLLGEGPFGVEGMFVQTHRFFQRDGTLVTHSRSFAVMGNAVLTTPRRWTEYSLRPFVSGGVGLMHVSMLDASGLLPVRSDLGAFNVGGGAVGFLSSRTGLRFDLRYYSSLHRIDQGAVAFGRVHLSYLTASIGVVLRR